MLKGCCWRRESHLFDRISDFGSDGSANLS
jgi:hypothetical protein